MSDDDLKKIIKSLTLSSLIATVDAEVFVTAIEQLARKAGVEILDDLSIPDWFSKQRALALEHHLVSLEDHDPAMAAMLQDHLDTLKRKGGITDSE